jgi:aminoglycoside phosphotransferase (APT) family kinase protein
MQFPNGSANLTYLLVFEDRRLVLRRPPFGHIAVGAHDMKREYRVLSRLWRHFDRAPRAYVLCEDHDVAGADFFVSEYRPGQVVWGSAPPSMAHYDELGRRVGFAVVDALADLHLLEPTKAEVGDLGRPEGFVDRQLSGWHDRWKAVSESAETPLMDVVAERLVASKPETQRSAILHNDFKVDNCQFDPQNPDRVWSIFDWDMATLGDPLVDVGILLNYWPDPSDGPVDGPVFPPGLDHFGLPTRDEVVERYAARTGIDLDRIAWYEAFASWKTGIVLQQLYARFLRGETSDERQGEKGGERVASQARRAMKILETSL